ncbi:helix-turn-helix domain-containing protein [Chitinophaga sp. sic0106]|uniref:helix-turn-helix domain-containing protein n=1 Tax=Chitinophaga sp. sic0106 TaxID=2854785 RepID=UPI001C485B02|nr:helix-turn-helix domain-containing protein [Chitinophaga sp. sic0106]MBV7529054.1 helix-turn-helix domain-containing protein [Chitinophaga sp. sic0106]
METIQISSLSLSEFQKILNTAIESAVTSAIAKFIAVKQDPNEEITVTDIAKMWSCSKQTIYRRIKDHKVPTVKLGRDIALKYKHLEIIKKPIAKG